MLKPLLLWHIAIVFLAVAFFSCENGKTGNTEPSQRNELEKNCPANGQNALQVGAFFESEADRNLFIKPWKGHYHRFSELVPFGWTDDDFKKAAALSRHVDLAAQDIRFADNDIAVFLADEKLCALTIQFLFSYLPEQAKKNFLKKMKGD